MSIMSFINKLLPKKIVETNLKRLSRFFDLTQDPFVPSYLDKSEKNEPDDWFSDNPPTYQSRHEYTPDYEKTAEDVVTMHEKMYRIATAKYNPFAIGGSEQLGGSEEWHDSKPG